MYQKERIDSIMGILKEKGYVTVEYLTRKLHYSNATINRDLNIMKSKKLIERSYGGVELCETVSVPLEFRYHKAKLAKNKISKYASEFICDGDTVFIDGTTTCEGIGKYILDKKDITVITNNMALVAHLSEYGIKVICTGGEVVEPPYMLSGDYAANTLLSINTDKMFFSSGAVSEDGKIGVRSDIFNMIYNVALKNSKEVYYLIDHSKLSSDFKYNVTDFSQVNAVISDHCFSDDVKKKFKDTKFYKV